MSSAKTPLAKILVVAAPDDHRARVVASLDAKPFEIHCADSASACIHLVRHIAPALIVMDRILPDGDGWELVRILKSLSSTRNAPVIAVTDDDSRRHVERAFGIGCEAILVKPLEAEALLRDIRRLLRTSGQSGV